MRPMIVQARQPSRMRRIGVLTGFRSDDPGGQVRLTAFAQGLQQSGWVGGDMCASNPAGAQAMPNAAPTIGI
jgi:hypothetical protein